MQVVKRMQRIAAGQWGMFTAAQAREMGIPAYALARAAQRDAVIRVHHGVYEIAGTAAWSSFGDWAAQWLALRPSESARRRRSAPDAILSHAAAAQVQRLGVITASGLELTAPHRINVRDNRVRTYRGEIGKRDVDWHVVEGFPVTTALRTVADLLAADCDGGHVGSVLASCLDRGLFTEADVLAECEPAASRWGHATGAGLLDSLLDSARVPATLISH